MGFGEAVKPAKSWGLDQLYFNTDRYLLSEIHLPWGMKPIKTIVKVLRFPQNGPGSLLWAQWRRARHSWQDIHKPCD